MNESEPSPERITTQEAARRLGVSPTQVRRLVAKGKLRAEQEQRPQGMRLMVLWDATQTPPLTHQSAPSTPLDVPTLATEDATLVASLQQQTEWLRERLEKAEEERSELRRMLLLEQQTVASLRAQIPAARDAGVAGTQRGTLPDAPAAPTEDDRLGLHTMAHELEKKRPWWWLRDWRRKGKV